MSSDMPKDIEEYSTSQKMHESLRVCNESLPNTAKELERRKIGKTTIPRESYSLTFGNYSVTPNLQPAGLTGMFAIPANLPAFGSNLLNKPKAKKRAAGSSSLSKPEEKEGREERRKESNRQSAARARKRKAEFQEAQVGSLRAQLAAANVPVRSEEMVCDSKEGYGVQAFEQSLFQAFKPFMDNVEKLKKLESEKEQIKKDHLTQVAKCAFSDEQNKELQNHNEDLEKENEELKQKIESQESQLKQLQQKLQKMQTQTDVYKKMQAKMRAMLGENDE